MKYTLQKLAFIALACITLSSCKTEEVYFNVTEPAPVTIPTYVKKVGIVNRSIISDSNNVRKAIDNVLSVKGGSVDKDCSVEAIRGLKDALVQSNIFQNIAVLDSVHLTNSFPGAFPTPLSWDKITEICRANNVDALFVLEVCHLDNKVNVVPSPTALIVGGGVSTVINTGWRVYDAQNKLILDEYPISGSTNVAVAPISPLQSAAAVMNRKDAVLGTSYNIGQNYASRILPYTIRVCRQFYIKGSDNFRAARRMADVGDWKNAADLWNKETNNPKAKIRARADYDMAIISELNGDLDGAIDWVKKSYETKGKRLALIYLNQLQNRKAQDDLLKTQAHGQ